MGSKLASAERASQKSRQDKMAENKGFMPSACSQHCRGHAMSNAVSNAPYPSPSPRKGGMGAGSSLMGVAGFLLGVKWVSPESFNARCPCHDDKRRSLSVCIGDTGKLLVHCFAGCGWRDIMRAIGAPVGDTFEKFQEVKADREVFTASYYAPLSLRWPLMSGWSYQHADGSHAFAVYRLDNHGKKEVRPVKPCDGGYTWGLPQAPRPLYRLPELMAHDGVIVVCEGEKATDAAVTAGWCATTSVGGASAASKSDWSPLSMRHVSIWPDNDGPGLKYAEEVNEILEASGALVTVMDPVGDSGDDAADHDVDAVMVGA